MTWCRVSGSQRRPSSGLAVEGQGGEAQDYDPPALGKAGEGATVTRHSRLEFQSHPTAALKE